MVNDGRMMQGKPIESSTWNASSRLWANAARGVSKPIRRMAWSNRWRSSALSMASLVAPIISTPWASSTPSRARSRAQLSAVWPPMVGSRASGFSASMMRATVRHSMGSM